MELLVNGEQASLLWSMHVRAGCRTEALFILGGFCYQDLERAGKDGTVGLMNKPKK